jgi:hypothetical protein
MAGTTSSRHGRSYRTRRRASDTRSYPAGTRAPTDLVATPVDTGHEAPDVLLGAALAGRARHYAADCLALGG